MTCKIENCGRVIEARGLCQRHYGRWRKHGDPLGGRASPGEPLKWLLSHVEWSEDDCLVWPFARSSKGYGQLGGDNAHRRMCEAVCGPAPSPVHQAAHNCGKGHLGCVNPSHVRWATIAENSADMQVHGTILAGERNGHSKLTNHQITAIRADVRSHTKLSRVYSVHRTTIARIRMRELWAHIP